MENEAKILKTEISAIQKLSTDKNILSNCIIKLTKSPILIRRPSQTLSWVSREWLTCGGPALCRDARKAERGKYAKTVLVRPDPPQWQLVNRKWTRHPPQFPTIFAVGHRAPSLRRPSPFLRIGSLSVFWDLSVGIKEVKAARIFAAE